MIYKKRILLITYGGGHVNMLLPVIKNLMGIPSYELIVLGLTTAGSVLKRNNIPYLGFKDFLYLFESEKVLSIGKRLAINTGSLVSLEESIAYLGINYLELISRYDEENAKELYTSHGRQIFYPIDAMCKIVRSIKPDLVIATNSPRSERAAINAAMSLSIPSICLVDLFGLQEAKWIANPGFANKVCVLSDFVRDYFIELGRAPDDLVVTGNPVFDNLSKFTSSQNHKNRRINSLNSSDKSFTILWASQPEPISHPFHPQKTGDSFLPRNIDEELFKIARNHPNFLIYIRLHPSENVVYTVNELPHNVKISPKDGDLHELISKVDLVITMTSTVAIEAALIGKTVVTVDLSIFTEDAPYSEMGLSRGIRSLSDLESVILDTISMPLPIEQIDSIVGRPGNATKNIISVIEDLLTCC